MTKKGQTVSVEFALTQCATALGEAGLQLLADESQDLLDIGGGFGQLRDLAEEGSTVFGGLSSFAGRLAGLAQHASRLGQLALIASGRTDAQTDKPTLN